MATLIADIPSQVDVPRKLWTRPEYEAICACGDLELKLELVEGELIDKMGKERPHTVWLVVLQEWLGSVFGPRFVNPETPIDVAPEDNPTNEPQPDIIVLN